VYVINKNAVSDKGADAQSTNIMAAKTVSSIVRTTLGPKAMLKMMLDPMGGIVMTNDGNAILREVDVTHPAAKSMIELSRAQDEEVGDGTTSVIILAGEMAAVAEPLLAKQIHPTMIVQAYMQTLEDMLKIMESFAINLDVNNEQQLSEVVLSSIDTKFVGRWGTKVSQMAIKAALCVQDTLQNGKKEIDMKRYAKVEKIPGGDLDDCKVLEGVMFNKDICHPRMRREIKNPRVLLLDCPLEYKKGESQTNVEVMKEDDFEKLLMQEEEEVKAMCDQILELKPDVVITEKGVSDLAQHFLLKGNVSTIRRIRKTDNNRIARISGATIVNRIDEITEKDIGEDCGLFSIRKVGEEFFTFMEECKEPKACTVILRGASRDVLNEIERNLQDAFCVARNILLEPKLLPGGGATEMELACRLKENAKSVEGVKQYAYTAVANAMEVIPRTLAQNCGVDVVRVLTDLRSKHAKAGEGAFLGIDGEKGEVCNVKEKGIMDCFVVKQQSIKTAIESACMLLRIDQVVSGISRKKAPGGQSKGIADGNMDKVDQGHNLTG